MMKEIHFGGVTEAGTGKPLPFAPRQEEASKANMIAKQERDEKLTLLEIGRAYNQNMLVAGRTPEYLYKGMKAGLPIEELFMIAVRGVAACMGDPMLEKVMARGLEERKNKTTE